MNINTKCQVIRWREKEREVRTQLLLLQSRVRTYFGCRNVETVLIEHLEVVTTNVKPLSAIAAARLRAEAAAKSIAAPEITPEPTSTPPNLLPESPDSEPEQEESEEEEPIAIQRNFKLCNWKNNSEDILSDTKSELTVSLKKHLTIALIGSFDLKVLRGAVNINGANIGAVTRQGLKAKPYRVFVPATHPISKIRGLDGVNHIQFLSCKEPTPFTKISPLFRDIWNAGTEIEKDRSFGIVSLISLKKKLKNRLTWSTPQPATLHILTPLTDYRILRRPPPPPSNPRTHSRRPPPRH